MFTIGTIYNRGELHRVYGGQNQGGISTPSHQSLIMLFSGETGKQYGYHDGWSDEGLFLYTGEGQLGDMTFVRGNLAIRDHSANSKDIHLFEYVRTGYVRYQGQMIYIGYHERTAPDRNGNDRKVIIFELAPHTEFGDETITVDVENGEGAWQEDLGTLRERAISTSSTGTTPIERRAIVRRRSNSIRIYVLRRADGVCEACGSEAPFITSANKPYLEPHHIRRLSDGGPDAPEYVVAVCPNCHRRAHYSRDKKDFNRELARIVFRKEQQFV